MTSLALQAQGPRSGRGPSLIMHIANADHMALLHKSGCDVM